jgi:hypothetical protein
MRRNRVTATRQAVGVYARSIVPAGNVAAGAAPCVVQRVLGIGIIGGSVVAHQRLKKWSEMSAPERNLWTEGKIGEGGIVNFSAQRKTRSVSVVGWRFFNRPVLPNINFESVVWPQECALLNRQGRSVPAQWGTSKLEIFCLRSFICDLRAPAIRRAGWAGIRRYHCEASKTP